jgi:hypothetical protein
MSAPVKNPPVKIAPKPEFVWPEEVLELARAKKADQYLDPMLEMTLRVIPAARWLHVYVCQDPEIAERKAIVFDVGLPDSQTFRKINKQWGNEWMRICPYPREPIFELFLDRGAKWMGPPSWK